MHSNTLMPAILRLKSATNHGRFGYEFGMMVQAFQPKFWTRAAQDISAFQEYANVPSRSAQN
jgi:hypothetical protein